MLHLKNFKNKIFYIVQCFTTTLKELTVSNCDF